MKITGRQILLAALVPTLQACTSAPPLPTPPLEPDASSAVVTDTATGGGPRNSGVFFSVQQVDGKSISNNLEASRRLSSNRGADLRIATVERKLPAGVVRLQLDGRVAYAMPIQELAAMATGRLRSVSGTLEVELEPNTRYVVVGVLDELRREVWLEEQASHRMVGTKIVGEPSAEALKAAAAEAMFTCCNLHYAADDDNWISDANWIDKPIIPVGTPIKVYEIRKDRAKAMIQGAPMWLGIDYGIKQQSVQQFVSRLAVKDDPKLRLASYAPQMQQAIRSGRLAVGMTRDQVLMSIGYPVADRTPSLDEPTWSYRIDDDVVYTIRWDADGRLATVEADENTRRLVMAVE